ncbi:MAG: hypothetical protein WAO83_16465 [Fuerstiella sp.]
MAKSRNQRKKSVADARVQYSLAMRVVMHFSIFIVAGTFFGIINQFLADPFGSVKENLMTFFRSSAPFLIALVCLMPVFVRDTLTLSNRVAGPIHNMRNTIRSLSNGETDVRPLKFRKGDFWNDLPDSFNKMVETLRNSQPVSTDTAASAKSQAAPNKELVEV